MQRYMLLLAIAVVLCRFKLTSLWLYVNNSERWWPGEYEPKESISKFFLLFLLVNTWGWDIAPKRLPSKSPPIFTEEPPTFLVFKPRDYRISSAQFVTHVAWNCDGKEKLATAVVDKSTRIWSPSHPELFCTSGQTDRRIVIWKVRRMSLWGRHRRHSRMTKNRPKRVVYGLFFFLSIFLRTIVLDFPVAVSIKAWTMPHCLPH